MHDKADVIYLYLYLVFVCTNLHLGMLLFNFSSTQYWIRGAFLCDIISPQLWIE